MTASASPRPRVYVIGTGGSISCIGESRTDLIDYNYADRHLSIEDMVGRIPEAAAAADIRTEQFLNVYGVDGAAVEAFVRAGATGLVGAGLGSGSAPRALLDALEAARTQDVVVVIASQAFNGRVMARRGFTERGFLVADNLALKKARILLMLALGATRRPEDIQRMILTY